MMNAASLRNLASPTDCHLLQAKRASNFFSEAYAEAYDKVMTAVPYGSWVDYLEDIAHKFDCRITRLLDAACGTGTFAMLALDRGIEVTGVDASPPMLDRFKRKVRNHPYGRRCRIIESSLATLAIADQADAAVCFFDSLNYIVDEDDFASALIGIARALRSKGLFLFDVNNVIAYEQNLFQQSGRVEVANAAELDFEWLGEYCADHSLYQLELCFVASDTRESRFRERHIQRFYSKETIGDYLAAAGFSNIHCFRAFSFEPGNAFDERWSFVAMKN